jgi:tetratricopeptide (TPR) repeat protein
MRRLKWWQLPVLSCLAAVATAQTPPADQSAPAPANPAAADTKPQVTVSAPRAEEPLPDLPADEFTRCQGMVGYETMDYTQAALCDAQLSREKHIVVEACINHKGDASAARVIQACSEALDKKIFEGSARYFLFASRAAGYLRQGERQQALDDFNEAVRLAPHNAFLFYNRGVYYSAQSDNEAALRDFDAALEINAKFVPALRQRARIFESRGNFLEARDEYSKAIGLEPNTAALWSERGYVALRQQDYASAVKDEAEAIRLDPKLARAYYLRGAAAAFGKIDDGHNAIDDVKAAVDLDPTLAGYVKLNGKAVSLTLPPL